MSDRHRINRGSDLRDLRDFLKEEGVMKEIEARARPDQYP